MCTASWLTRADGYELFFNRDEMRTRGRARPPTVEVRDGVRLLLPRDADAGGTWLAVNEHGLALGLLNAGSDAAEPPPAPRSRGLLVADLATARTAGEVRARLEAERLERYLGFRLLVVEPGGEPTTVRWGGRELEEQAASLPLVSSSLDEGAAERARRDVFAGIAARALDAPALETFHASHEPERGPWSPCMHRADARTVSACHLRVDAGVVRLRYAAGPPCQVPFAAPLELERAPAARWLAG